MTTALKSEDAVDPPRIYRAPGRVNLIGEHTDYNDGFVLPAAVDLFTQVAVSPRSDRMLIIYSETLSERVEVDLDDPNPRAIGHWSDYVRGVAFTFEQAGYRLKGADVAIRSDVPMGAGLSSSAAVEVATGYALVENSDSNIDRVDLARLCQRAENEFVGARCGIMDQFVSCLGKAGHALLLDCRSLEYRLLPLPESVRLVICNTMVNHKLASSEYNIRRLECEAGVFHLGMSLSNVSALRDLTLIDLEYNGEDLDEIIYKRCRHVISENERVLKAAESLERGDLDAFGGFMAESHASLRDDYQVSCEELDIMVEIAARAEGVYGAKLTGAGFGGCTINLVEADSVARFKQAVAGAYQQATGIAPQIYVCSTSDGVAEQ